MFKKLNLEEFVQQHVKVAGSVSDCLSMIYTNNEFKLVQNDTHSVPCKKEDVGNTIYQIIADKCDTMTMDSTEDVNDVNVLYKYAAVLMKLVNQGGLPDVLVELDDNKFALIYSPNNTESLFKVLVDSSDYQITFAPDISNRVIILVK